MAPRATFFLDFGSPYSYLAAERIEEVLGEPVAWMPVFLVGVFKATGRRSWVYSEDAASEWAEIERRLAERGLPPLALVEDWAEKLMPRATPARSTLLAQRVATAALDAGRERDFCRTLLRSVFRDAGDLTDEATVRAAATAAGVTTAAVDEALADPLGQERVRERTAAAVALGVDGVPTVVIGNDRFWGDDRLEDAARALRG